MYPEPWGSIFVGSNIGIFLGYVFVAVFIAPRLKLKHLRTKVAGSVFFLTCGLTHLELAYHYVEQRSPFGAGEAWHMVPLHLIQLAAVIVFVEGLHAEFIREGAPWPPEYRKPGEVLDPDEVQLRVGYWNPVLRRAAIGAFLAVVALGGVLAWSLLRPESAQEVRLGPYPLQHVASRVPGVAGPAVKVTSQAVVIEGTLCNNNGRTVPVLTTLGWQAYTAAGEEVTGSAVTIGVDIQQQRKAGCDRHTEAGGDPFVNPIPSNVVAINARLLAGGGDPRWRVQGFEVPTDQSGNVTGPRTTFRSDLFRVVP